jgi:hypothetical protein
MCNLQSFKELIGESLQPTEVGIFTTPMFYKYTTIFFICQIFLKLFCKFDNEYLSSPIVSHLLM